MLRLLAIGALALLSTLAAAQPAEAPQASADQLAKQVETNEEALQRLHDKATSVLDELSAAEEQVRAMEDAAAASEEQAQAAAAKAKLAQAEEEAARQSFTVLIEQLSPRLRARYQLGRQQRASIMLASSSVGDLLWRQKALELVLAEDLKALERAKLSLAAVQQKRAKAEEAKREHLARVQSAQAQREAARGRKEQLTALHSSIVEEQDLKERALVELQRQHQELTRMIEELQGDLKASSFARRKGKLPFPASGPIEVGFGKVVNPKFNTVTFQKGIDLRAPEGSPVVAVGPGKVVHAGPFRGYGNLVIVDHGDAYHSLYAHLGRLDVAVGADVEQGQTLGAVGDTGSMKGAYLYFEIREKGKPVDPKSWLGAP